MTDASSSLRLIASNTSWQQQLRDVITSAEALHEYLELPLDDCAKSALAEFPLRVPTAFAQRMRKGDHCDPLLLQVMAQAVEMQTPAGYSKDPLAETGAANPTPGLIRKYHNRALLIVTGTCAIHCRYCFRRHFPYSDNQNSRSEWQHALAQIAAAPELDEVILSGGDPLVATDAYLEQLVTQIAAIPHIKRLRIHSRLPIVIPARVTDHLLRALSSPELDTVMVVHANHANELDQSVADALQRCAGAGMTLLNQSVLLRGVNDTPQALVELSRRLFDCHTLPYYLHLLDPVIGAAHFDVPETSARRLVAAISADLPGYLVPRLAREEPGAHAKTVLAPLAD